MLKSLTQDETENLKLIVNSEEFSTFVNFLNNLLAKEENSVIMYDYMGGSDRELALKLAHVDGYRKLINDISQLKKTLT